MEKLNNMCSECGCVDEELFELEIDGELRKVCETCAHNNGYVRCDVCGEWLSEDDAMETADGDTICQSCYDDYYFTCEECGEIHSTGEAICVNRDTRREMWVCDDCANRDYYQCSDCGEWFSSEYITHDDGETFICENCESEWCTCEDCGTVVSIDNATWSDEDDCWYCDDCYDGHCHSGCIHDYGYKPYPEFKKLARESNSSLFFGVELEVDYGDSAADLSNDLDDMGLPIYMKHDGSLDEGLEIVTHPATLQYHMSRMDWEGICDTCSSAGFKSHDTTTCGLHVHVGRSGFGETESQQQKVAANLVLIANAIWNDLVTFTRRKACHLDRWAAQPALDVLEEDVHWLTDDELVERALETRNRGRYQGVNLMNSATVEFRVFRGTLKYTTLLASIQLVRNMTMYAMSHTPKECINATFSDIVDVCRFDELTSYCADRGIELTDNSVAVQPKSDDTLVYDENGDLDLLASLMAEAPANA